MRTRESQIPAKGGASYSLSELDSVLTTQLIIGWAGESGEDRRLGWWQADLSSEFGGADLFARLVPGTWRWAVLQGAREAARRRDIELRAHDHDPDRLVTVYRLGFDVDERLDERLQDLKRSNADPALPTAGLDELVLAFVLVFIDWKFYTLFSFLFGLGFSVQLMRAEARGSDALPVYRAVGDERQMIELARPGQRRRFLDACFEDIARH